MDRCSALTARGHEDSSNIRSLGNPEKALLELGIATMTSVPLNHVLKNAVRDGLTDDEIQDIVSFAWKAGNYDRAVELSKLVAEHRGTNLPETKTVKVVITRRC